MGQRGAGSVPVEEPVVQPTPNRRDGMFSPMLLVGLGAAVLIAVALSVFIVTRIIGPQVEQRRILKEEIEQTGQTIDRIIESIQQYPLDPIIVNLAGTNAERYLKVSIALGYEVAPDGEDQVRHELDRRRPEIQNQLITILSAKQLGDVDSVEGREAIRREILNRINGMLVSGRVTNVYYTEFVVQ